MESKANYFNVGLLALIAGVLAMTWLANFGGERHTVDYDRYRLEFTGSIQGLDVGSQVTFNGLPIGRVAFLTLGSIPSKVDVFIDIQKGIRIYENSTVSLVYRGVTGIASVEITGGTTDTRKIDSLNVDSGAYISARGSVVSDVVDGARRLIERITVIADRVDGIVESNEADLKQTISGLAQLSQTLGNNSEALIRFISEAESFVSQFETLAKNTNNLILSANKILNDSNTEKIASIIHDASTVIEKIDNLAEVSNEAADQLIKTLSDISQGAKSVSVIADQGHEILGNFDNEALASLVTNMANFSKTVQSSGQKLDEIMNNFLVVSNKSIDIADSVVRFVEPLQKEFDEGGSAELISEVIGSIRSIGRAAREIANFTNDANAGLNTIENQIEDVLASAYINIETIGEQMIRILERFERNPQSFIFQNETRSAYGEAQ